MPTHSPTFAAWVHALRASAEGRIWWANLVLDVGSGNLPCAVFARLRATLRRAALAPASGPHRLSADARALLLRDAVQVLDQAPASFQLQSPRRPPAQALVRVMDATSWGSFHLSADLGEKLDDRIGERVMRGLGRSILPRHYTGWMRTAKPFFWATPSRDFDQRGDSTADGARDALGLGHLDMPQDLVVVHIPKARLKGVGLRAPTTLDAGDSPWFSPWPGPESTGRTRNLRDGSPGLPELLVEPLALDDRCTVTPLGRTTALHPPDKAAWAQAAERRAGL